METTLFPYLVSALCGMLGLLTAVLGWFGTQVSKRLDTLNGQVGETNVTLAKIERDLRSELSQLDRRVAVIEARCDFQHGRGDE